MATILLDALVIFTLCATILLCFKRGFIRSLLGLIGNLAALVISYFLSGFLAPLLYNSLLKDLVTQRVAEQLALSPVEQSAQALFDQLPSWIQGFPIQGGSVYDQLSQAQLQTNLDAANWIQHQLLAPILILLISSILFFVCFLVVRLLLAWLNRMLGIFQHIPLLSSLNKLLGALMGVFEGAVLLILFASITSLILLLTGNQLSWLNDAVIQNTSLFYLFYKLNPLHLFSQ